MPYNPTDWYWIKDGADEAFSSKRGLLVPLDDAGYLAHIETEGAAQRWPVDAAGVQTDAALQAVLTPYDMHLGLKAYAEAKRRFREASGVEVTVDGNSVMAPTDEATRLMISGFRQMAEADNAFTTPYQTADGSIITVTAAMIIEASDQVNEYIKDCFVRFKAVSDGIDANTITTRSQVDAVMDA